LSKIRNFILPPYLILYVFLNQIIQLVGWIIIEANI
jgi:hypothetical protein